MKSLESSLGPMGSFLRQNAPSTVMDEAKVELFCLSERAQQQQLSAFTCTSFGPIATSRNWY